MAVLQHDSRRFWHVAPQTLGGLLLALAHGDVAERALRLRNTQFFAEVLDPGRRVDAGNSEEGRRLGEALIRRGHVEGRLFHIFFAMTSPIHAASAFEHRSAGKARNNINRSNGDRFFCQSPEI